MITGIAIENFKAIRDRVYLELRPITLLFGPNSAGKSTVLHALHYTREVFERHNLDADITLAGGRFVDLGGFRNFVYDRDLSRSVVLRFDLDLKDRDLPVYISSGGWLIAEKYELPELSQAVQSASVEIAVSWSSLREAFYVSHYSVWINGGALATIRCNFDRREVMLTDINYTHPVLPPLAIVDEMNAMLEAGRGEINLSAWGIQHQTDALPTWGNSLSLTMFTEPTFKERTDEETSRCMALGMDAMVAMFSQLIVGPGELLSEALRDFCYLGPFRETPPRNFAPPRFPEPSRWANGLAAWDQLHADPSLVKLTNKWLSGADSLEVGYSLRIKQTKEIPLDSPLLVLLRSERAFDDLEDIRKMIDEFPTRTSLTLIEEGTGIEVLPHDVGVGISQLIPVVVLAVDRHAQLAGVEQPELHVHPAVQVGLGDLFIQQITADPARRFLLETHSEHLMLRLLRRIRETTDNELPPGHPGLKPDQIAVYYVEPAELEPKQPPDSADIAPVHISRLQVDETGEFKDRWPKGFFEERGEELF